MRPAIAALSAALLFTGAASAHAQDPAGTTEDKGTASAQPGSDSGQPAIGIQGPKLTPKLLIDTFNVLTRPRPSAPPEPAVAPAAVTPASAEPAAVAVAPAPAVVATPAAVIPRDVKPQPSPVVPRAAAVAAPPRPVAVPTPTTPVVQPAEPVSTPSTGPAVVAVSEPAATQAPVAVAAPEPATPVLGTTTLLMLGLLAAAATAAAVIGLQHARRIARTRAALALTPRLDLSAGATSLTGLALAGPPLAIRARLDGAP